jgi:hypothetical protein
VELFEPAVFYRLNEEDENGQRAPFVSAFAEYRPTPRTTVQIGVENAIASAAYRERTFFQPDRRTRTPSAIEFRHRNRYVVPYLTLKHAFG